MNRDKPAWTPAAHAGIIGRGCVLVRKTYREAQNAKGICRLKQIQAEHERMAGAELADAPAHSLAEVLG